MRQSLVEMAILKRGLRLPTAHSLVVGGIAMASVLLALLASFGLANWAEASSYHHGIQHVLLFVAGMGVGGSLIQATHRKRSK